MSNLRPDWDVGRGDGTHSHTGRSFPHQRSGFSIVEGSHGRKRRFEQTSEDTEYPMLQPKLPKLEDEEEESHRKGKKYVRKRMKFLLQAILDQMEFYFSDSNLSKDRYLKKIMEQSSDGYVDLSVFGNFNKLQSLNKDGVSLKMLSKAIGNSKFLQLSEDKTRVKRLNPFKEISVEETDNRTVYVEYLPKYATHGWIQTTFADCGKVMYVSLPKFPSTREIKGFAFVEFQTADEAEKACKMLNNPPVTREGDKPGRFPRGNKTLDRLEKIVPPRPDQDSNEENLVDESKDDEPKRKKKKKSSSKKKQGSETSIETETQVSEVKQEEEGVGELKRKKKKKKKKKQGQSLDDSLVKDEDESAREGKEDSSVRLTEKVQSIEKSSETARTEPLDVSASEVPETEEGLSKKRRKKKKRKKGIRKSGEEAVPQGELREQDSEAVSSKQSESQKTEIKPEETDVKEDSVHAEISKSIDSTDDHEKTVSVAHVLGRMERKRLRQEDIKKKKKKPDGEESEKRKESGGEESNRQPQLDSRSSKDDDSRAKQQGSGVSSGAVYNSEIKDSDMEEGSKNRRKSDGSELTSILKTKQKSQKKVKVEFNPVPVTQEFVREKEIRKRRKVKKDKPQLRVISKKEWLSLRSEYLSHQKSHMTALKESLRELRQQENQNMAAAQGSKHVDLEDVFGTKRLKPSKDVKMAHVESLKFTPNVIVQWKSSNEMHRDKIRTMFKDISGDSIAYIDAQEEAKTGYIRFKDEASADHFARLSRHSNSFSARLLPVEQQQTYWDKANADRMKKLGRKKQEKGSERIARKVFERNKTTFHEKPSRICFKDDSDDEQEEKSQAEDKTQIKDPPQKDGDTADKPSPEVPAVS